MAPYVPDSVMDEDEDFDTNNGVRVMGVTYLPDWEVAGFAAVVDGDGEMTDFIRLPHIMKRKNAWKDVDRDNKVKNQVNLLGIID